MVPTDPPGLEDRNVRWCHCACREPHPSPVLCCSAWGSYSRGRRRWPEWRWQERLSERRDKYLWQLPLNKHLPAWAQMAITSMSSCSPLSMLAFLLPAAPSTEGKSTIPDVRKTPSVLVHQSPSPRLNPSSAALCLCKASRLDETMEPCAAQQQGFTAVAQCAHTAPCFPPPSLNPLLCCW